MDLTKEAIEFLQESAKPNTINNMGNTFCDKKLYRLDNYLYPDALLVSTLSSITEYLNADIDDDLVTKFLIIIDSPTQVRLLSEVDDDMKRVHLMTACADLPKIEYGKFLEREPFNIMLQSCFSPTGDQEVLLLFISSVQAGTITEYSDTGFSQKATVKQGHLMGNQMIPSPVVLAPYRSFIEIEQPESSFVFRMMEEANSIGCAIFEADGGAWRRRAVQRIKDWLLSNVDQEVMLDTVIIG